MLSEERARQKNADPSVKLFCGFVPVGEIAVLCDEKINPSLNSGQCDVNVFWIADEP